MFSLLRLRSKLLPLFVALSFATPLAWANEIADWAEQELDQLIPLYEHFHRFPELSFQEAKTSERLAAELKAAGFEVTTGVGGYGVVGILKNGDGPVVMFRSDMDALPVQEETGLPYASQAKGKNAEGVESSVMHACGHDVHMTNLVGLARILSKRRDLWSGTVMLIGQPAEELTAGAKKMLDDGLFTRFTQPQFALALHCDSFLRTGAIGVRPGYVLANSDSCTITMKGRGGHGSAPHKCIDPIVQAAQLVVDLQSIVAREISPLEQAVITVGAINGGTKHNIIPNECKLQLTIRSYTPEVRKQLLDAIERKARAVALSFNAPEPTIVPVSSTPATKNDEALLHRILPAMGESIGEENLHPSVPSMGAEDFSRYGLAGTPIVMLRLGTVSPEKLAAVEKSGEPLPSLHASTYAPDVRPSLKTGLTASTAAMLSLLGKK